ncbi:chromosome partitioning protein ParB, partial [bacterium]
MVEVEGLAANPNQPRKTFNDEGLAELASSIRENGVLQPILVRRVGAEL